MLLIRYPWLTVQRHLSGKHNQKDHNPHEGGAGVGLNDEAEREFQAKKRKYADLGSDADIMDDNQFMVWVGKAEAGWKSQTGGYMDLTDFLDRTFNYNDTDSGIGTGITSLDADENGIYVKGVVYDRGGVRIGRFERGIKDGTVDHAYFKMDSQTQGKGFGAKFYQHLEESYYDAGLAEVTIEANIDVGGYAWAKMGYDFQDDSDRKKAVDVLALEYDFEYGAGEWTKKVNSGEMVEPYHAWEVAAFAGPDGKRLGKQTMLGSKWMAFKSLDEDSPTWQAGEDYYKSKGL